MSHKGRLFRKWKWMRSRKGGTGFDMEDIDKFDRAVDNKILSFVKWARNKAGAISFRRRQ